MQHPLRPSTMAALLVMLTACAESAVGPTASSDLSLSRRASGTTLSATVTAAGFREAQVEYDWTIDNKVSAILAGEHMTPEARTDATVIPRGSDKVHNVKWIQYEIAVTKAKRAESLATGARGQVCVTNSGGAATEALTITDVVQVKTSAGQFQDYLSKVVDVSSKGTLAPGETHCYPYEVAFAAAADAQYRNAARVTITNYSGHVGETFGPDAGAITAGFAIPTSATAVTRDGSAVIDEHLIQACSTVFPSIICTWEDATGPLPPFTVTESQVIHVMVDMYNYHSCGEEFDVRNGATLTEGGPRASGEAAQVRTAGATLHIKTGDCPPKPPATGCTLTQGYWKNHTWVAHGPFSWEDPKWKFFDTGSSWRSILYVQPRGDAYYILAHQYIAARLNEQNGAYVPPEVRAALAGAYAYFSMSAADRARADRAQLTAWANLLDRYNSGQLGVPHCG